jgi:hypothetical protein
MGTSEARMAQGPTDRPSPIVTTRARSGWHEDGTAVAMPEGSTGRCLATRLSHRKWSGRGQKVVIPCHSPVDAARAFPEACTVMRTRQIPDVLGQHVLAGGRYSRPW